MKRAGATTASVLLASVPLGACSLTERPCQWQTAPTARDGSTPGVELVCDDGQREAALVAYESSVSPSSGSESLLALKIVSSRAHLRVQFGAALADGTYDLGAGGKTLWVERTWPAAGPGSPVTGTLRFARSRDIPFADLEDPEARVHVSTIDVDLELVALPSPSGCRVTTSGKAVRLLQQGPVTMCSGGLGGWH